MEEIVKECDLKKRLLRSKFIQLEAPCPLIYQMFTDEERDEDLIRAKNHIQALKFILEDS